MNYARRTYHLTGAAVFLVALVVYILTMSRSASFWDCGEFIATSYTLGIPHSPGTPLYVLVGRVFSLLPLPLTVAGRVNFASSLFGALAAAGLYYVVVKLVQVYLGRPRSVADCLVQYGGGVVGAFFIAFSHTFWTNAIEAEVYSLAAFLMVSVTLLVLKWGEDPESPRSTLLMLLVIYLLGIGVGFHLGTVLAFAGPFIYFFLIRRKRISNFEFFIFSFGLFVFLGDTTLWRNGQLTLILLAGYLILVIWTLVSGSRFAAAATGLFLLGVSVHLYLFIRSHLDPSIDEADPETWRNLYAVLRREQYPPSDMTERRAPFSFQLFTHFGGYFLMQFEMFARRAGGMLFGKIPAPHWSVALPVGLGIIGMIEHFLREKRGFVLIFATFLVTSLGLVIFLNFKVDEVRERDYFYSPAFYYFAVFIGIGAVTMLQMIRSGVRNPRRMMGALAAGTALLVTFSCLPAKRYWFTHDRTEEKIPVDYAHNMLVSLEQNAILFTNGDNDTFPLWYIQEVEGFRKDIRVVNLSLLNTPWYIRQLRDEEPKVPISYGDEKINSLRPVLDRRTGRIVLIRDFAMNNIVVTNGWNGKPIYFAVTIPKETLEPYMKYLEMEGLSYRLVPREGRNMINDVRMATNLWDRYRYRGILIPPVLSSRPDTIRADDSIYKDENTVNLIQNYSAAFAQLAYLYANREEDPDLPGAIRNLEVAGEITPDLEPVLFLLGSYYVKNGQEQKALEHFQEAVAEHPDRSDLRYRLAWVLESMGDYQACLRVLDDIIRRDPDYRQAYHNKFTILVRLGRVQEAVLFAESYIRAHPEDGRMPQILEEVKQRLGTSTPSDSQP
jgi:hypothetical protein